MQPEPDLMMNLSTRKYRLQTLKEALNAITSRLKTAATPLRFGTPRATKQNTDFDYPKASDCLLLRELGKIKLATICKRTAFTQRLSGFAHISSQKNELMVQKSNIVSFRKHFH